MGDQDMQMLMEARERALARKRACEQRAATDRREATRDGMRAGARQAALDARAVEAELTWLSGQPR